MHFYYEIYERKKNEKKSEKKNGHEKMTEIPYH